MKKLSRLLFLFFIPGLMVSCETDFNVIADYKEIAIVYGLLNQNDTVHYLRINKAFLGDGNALTYAEIADSSGFGGDITVVLTETTDKGITKQRVFDTVTLYDKQPGVFYSPEQLFYYFKDPVGDSLNPNSTFALKITNKKTGNEVSAKTSLIHNFFFTTPTKQSIALDFQRASKQQKSFVWQNAVNAKRYKFNFYFNYKELSLAGDTTHRQIEWVFPEQTTDDIVGSFKVDVFYYNEDFYKLCESKIPYADLASEDAVSKRFASTCILEVTAVGDEFNTYLEANGPSTGVLIEKPSYSNITNGLGLLSSMFRIQRTPIPLNSKTVLDLATTTALKFEKPN
jgi:hypothetical protein